MVNYLNNKSRSKNEFFISNFLNEIVLNDVFSNFLSELNSATERSFFRVNSGFSIVLFAYLFSIKYNLELDIYGLDMGEGESGYFDDESAKLGHSVNGKFPKKEVSDFFDIVYNKDTAKKIKNFSYFKNRI